MPVHKIKIGDLIKELVDEALQIESSKLDQKEKTQKFKRLAISFMNKMYGDKRRKESDRIKPNTAKSYLTRARNACKEHLDSIHHRFDSEVHRLSKKWGFYSENFLELLDLPTVDARKAKKVFLGALLDCKELIETIDDLDFSKKNINKTITALADDNPFFKAQILTLLSDDKFRAKQSLINAFNDATDVYDDLIKVKVDHELIVNLAMSKADADYINRKQKRSLNTKKHDKVYVDYPRYIQDMVNIFLMPKEVFTGKTENIAPLIFALAAASGRRPIEIIYTGNFKAKGKHTLIFTGQAKKRDGEDVDKERTIYSLVDSKIFVEAFQFLRSSNALKSITVEVSSSSEYKDQNEVIKGKISPHLSSFTKNFFVDKNRVFKDTRGIYGKICFQTWYKTDKRWRGKDDNVFFSELFGHSDTDAQAHYMSYELNNYNQDFVANEKPHNERWQQLCELDDIMPSVARVNAAVEIHNYIKEQVLINPNIEFNQTQLTTNKVYGKFRKRSTVKNYLDVIGDLRFAPEPLTTQVVNEEIDLDIVKAEDVYGVDVADDKKIKTVKISVEPIKKTKADKPHINAKLLNNDLWEVIVKLGNKTQMFNLKTDSKITAMKIGYALFVGDLFEFKVVIPYKTGPHFEDILYAKNEKAAEVMALNDAGLDGFRGSYNKIQVKKP